MFKNSNNCVYILEPLVSLSFWNISKFLNLGYEVEDLDSFARQTRYRTVMRTVVSIDCAGARTIRMQRRRHCGAVGLSGPLNSPVAVFA